MILVILASGLGNRTKSYSNVIKPLIDLNSKPIIWWCLKSYNDLITSGLVKKKDIFIVVNKRNLTQFKSNETLKEFFGKHNPYLVLNNTTRGPLESLYLGLLDNKLSKKDNTSILVSDCDHHFVSYSIRRNLIKQTNDFAVWQTTKKKSNLNWCFYKNIGKESIFVEKPKSRNGIDTSKGLIGIYYFKNINIVKRLAKKILTKRNNLGELFISDLLNQYIKNGKSLSVNFIENFFSLGTTEDIYNSINALYPNKIMDPKTYFFDLDGIIVKHNYSLNLNRKNREFEILDSAKKLINSLFDSGNKVIITTSRPKLSDKNIISQLNQNHIQFDEVLTGLTGGPRQLINDLKPGKEAIPTAVAFNSFRDLDQLSTKKFRSDINFIEDISGGSGAKTHLIEVNGKKYVRKFSPFSILVDDKLNYQKLWYQVVLNALNNHSPKVVQLDFSHSLNGISYFDTEYIPDLIKLSDFLNSENKTEILSKLITVFNKLYSIFENPKDEIKEDIFIEILTNKVQPSIDYIQKKLQLSNDLIFNINGLSCRPFDLFKSKFKIIAKKSFDFTNIKPTLIHGDPTFENLMINTTNKVLYLLDPVGSMIDPNFKSKNITGTSHPLFDLARMELSSKFNYESIKTENIKNTIQFKNNMITIDSKLLELLNGYSIVNDTQVNTLYSKYNLEDLPFFLLTTILRILKYKRSKFEVISLITIALIVSNEIK